MKFTPEIIAALQTLKNAAENDFEKRRIEVLERDLTAPPKVEVVDDKNQKFDGITYKQDKNGHFGRIHRAVYHYYFGDIPEGYEIHHIDENKANNDISNLVMMTKSEHRSFHSQSEKKTSYICENCGKEYESKVSGQHKFCSPKCQAAFYYKTQTEIRQCETCGKDFATHKYHKIRFCSAHCAGVYSAKKRLENYVPKPESEKWHHIMEKRFCVICGKEFETRKSRNTQTCSPACSGILRSKNRLSKKESQN